MRSCVLLVKAILFFLVCTTATSILAQNCDSAMDCSLKVDTRDCTPVDNRPWDLQVDNRSCGFDEDRRSCGHDVGPIHFNDPGCEAAKAAENVRRRADQAACEAAKAFQNQLYASQKSACEAAKAAQNAAYIAQRPACESAKATQNALYAAEKAACETNKAALKAKCEAEKADLARKSIALVKKINREATELGLRALPGDVRHGVEHLGAEAKNEIEKYPVVASVLATTLRLSNPLLADQIDAIFARNCDPIDVITRLSSASQRELDKPTRDLGALTTPLKDIGVSGWIATGCWAEGVGVLERDAAHSSDRLYTVDVKLTSFSIEGHEAGAGRYLRIEIEPKGNVHSYAARHSLAKNDTVSFAGPVLIDTDLPSPFLEVHPIDDFQKR